MSARSTSPWIVVCLLIAASRAPAQEAPPRSGHLLSIEVIIADLDGSRHDDAPDASPANLRETVQSLHQEGKLDGFTRVRLSALENQPAMFQMGRRTPVVTGRTRTTAPGRGGGVSMSLENTGTMISATARVRDNGVIAMELQLEQSQLVRTPDAGNDDARIAPIRASTVTTLTANTTLSVRDGETALVAGSRTSSDGKSSESVILVTARVIERTTEVAADETLRIFHLKHAAAADLAKVVGNLTGNDPLALVIDNRTNSIIARGDATHVSLVESLLTVLDAPMP